MAIEKKFICFQTQSEFDERLSAGDILDDSIVFIVDTQRIWHYGTYFGSGDIDKLTTSNVNTVWDTVEDDQTTSKMDDKYAAGEAVGQMIKRIVRADETDTIDKVLVISDGHLRLAPISLFKVEYTLTVHPTPSNATVTLNGVRTTSVSVSAGSSVYIEVSATGYVTHTETVIVNKDTDLYVVLEEDEQEELTVSSSSTTLAYDGGTFNLTVTSNTSWNITQSGDISLSFNQTSGTGNATVVVTYPQNPSKTNRPTGTITVTTASGGLSRNVSLTQLAATPEVTASPIAQDGSLGDNFTVTISVNDCTDALRVDTDEWYVANAGGISSISLQGSESHMITSNGTYSVSPGDSFYMIVSTTAGTGGTTRLSTLEIRLTPYNGEQAGNGIAVTIGLP